MFSSNVSRTIALTVGVLAMVFLISYVVMAVWTEPGTTPPGGNVPAPLNVSATAQTKEGALTIAAGGGDALILRNGGDLRLYNTANTGSALLYTDNNGEIITPGNLTVGGNITVAGQNVCRQNGTNCPSMASAGGWTDDGIVVRLTTLTDNVGIGTASPGAYKLNVSGDANATRLCIAGVCQSSWPSGGGGDITGVIAGTGLTGGGLSGDVTLSADTGYLQRRVSGTCAAGSSIRVVSADGTVICQTDDVGITSETDPQVGTLANGKWCNTNGTQVICNSDLPAGGTVTSVGSGAGLTGGPIITSGTLSIDTSWADNRYVNTAGDTMTGKLSVSLGSDNMLTFVHSGTTKQYTFAVGTDGAIVIKDEGGNVRLKIDSSGNVGIGTASPSQKLDVVGNIKGTQLCIGSDCRSSWPSGGGGDITGVIAGTGLTGGGTSGDVSLSADTTYLQKRVSGTCAAGSSIRVVNSDGTVACQTDNVGITSETDTLQAVTTRGATTNLTVTASGLNLNGSGVEGNISAINQLTGYNDIFIRGNSAETAPVYLTGNQISAYTGGIERMKIDSSGNVGIGTASPSQKLDVVGNIKGTQLCIGSDCRSSWPSGGGGDITGVIAGTGLTGGGTSGDVSLSADTTYLQKRVSGTCAAGSSIRVVNSDGTVACQTDNVGITSETDPQVGTLTNTKWCTTDGSAVNCTSDAPAGGGTPIPTGLYGYCRYIQNPGGSSCGPAYPPAYCAGVSCACPSGYTLVQTAYFWWTDSGWPQINWVSCLKN